MFHHQGSLPWTRLLLIYEWNVEHASKGVLLQKISSHSHRPLNFYPRKLETERRKLLCLTIFYEWSKAAAVTSWAALASLAHSTTQQLRPPSQRNTFPILFIHTLWVLCLWCPLTVWSSAELRTLFRGGDDIYQVKKVLSQGFPLLPCLHWFRQRD